MKVLFKITLALVLSVSAVKSTYAANNEPVVVFDLTGDKFKSADINAWAYRFVENGLQYGGADVILTGSPERDFTLEVRTKSPSATCAYRIKSQSPATTTLRLKTRLNVNRPDCSIVIKYNDGRQEQFYIQGDSDLD